MLLVLVLLVLLLLLFCLGVGLVQKPFAGFSYQLCPGKHLKRLQPGSTDASEQFTTHRLELDNIHYTPDGRVFFTQVRLRVRPGLLQFLPQNTQ